MNESRPNAAIQNEAKQPATPSGAEPRSGETPFGAGADLLERLEHVAALHGSLYHGPLCREAATELRRLAAEVERTTGPGSPSYRLNWLLDELGKRFPYMAHLSAEGPETQFVREVDRLQVARDRLFQDRYDLLGASEWVMRAAAAERQVKELRATQQAAAEQMREAAGNLAQHSGKTYASNIANAIRALSPPTPDLDAIREAARAEGYAAGRATQRALLRRRMIEEAERRGAERAAKTSWRLVKIHPKGWDNEDAEALHVQAIMREVFPAAPEVPHA